MSWSKVLSKPFILMQCFSKAAEKKGSYGDLNIFKMAVMDAYLRLCDITQPKLYMQKQIIKCFQEHFCFRFYRSLFIVTSYHFPKIKPNS